MLWDTQTGEPLVKPMRHGRPDLDSVAGDGLGALEIAEHEVHSRQSAGAKRPSARVASAAVQRPTDPVPSLAEQSPHVEVAIQRARHAQRGVVVATQLRAIDVHSQVVDVGVHSRQGVGLSGRTLQVECFDERDVVRGVPRFGFESVPCRTQKLGGVLADRLEHRQPDRTAGGRPVTSDEAAAVLGDEPGEPTNVDVGGVGACTYRLADGSAAVQINVERGDADTFLSQISEGRGEELEGVGDAAVANETLGQVTVVKGDVRFAVFVSLADGEKTDLDTLFVLATTAVGRL